MELLFCVLPSSAVYKGDVAHRAKKMVLLMDKHLFTVLSIAEDTLHHSNSNIPGGKVLHSFYHCYPYVSVHPIGYILQALASC